MTIPRGRTPYVVDTNVAVVANRTGGESYGCASACSQALLKIRSSGVLVLDEGRRILSEYFRICAPFAKPGMGNAFVKWAHDNQGKYDLVQTVAITPLADDPTNFAEFPTHDDLAEFDPSDRKFVAVATAHPENPSILQATDSKWWGCRTALFECGIVVKFLCPAEIKKVYERKFGELT